MGRGAFNKSGLLSPALSSCGEERENMTSGQAVVEDAPNARSTEVHWWQLMQVVVNFVQGPAHS